MQPLNEVTIPQIRRIDPKEIRASTFDDSNGQAKTNRTGSSASNILKHSSFQKHIQVSTEISERCGLKEFLLKMKFIRNFINLKLQRPPSSSGGISDVEQQGSIQNVINRKRCVTESATGQTTIDEFNLEDFKGKLNHRSGFIDMLI